MPERLSASAIVLAGGRSSRFTADKIAAEIDGVPLLHHSLRVVAAVCAEVVVVGPPGGLSVALPADLVPAPIVTVDRDANPGPLIALLEGARRSSFDRLLLVGGDMPTLVPGILRRLLTWQVDVEGACVLADDRAQPLPMALDRSAALTQGASVADAGARSLRALIAVLTLEQIPEHEWRTIDPDGASLRDIDRPGDVEAWVGEVDPEPGVGDATIHDA